MEMLAFVNGPVYDAVMRRSFSLGYPKSWFKL